MPSSNERKYQTQNPIVRWFLERFLARLEAHVRALAPARLVDLGSGEGLVVTHLWARGLRFEYLGIDRSTAAVGEARARAPELRFIEGDVTSPPESAGWADLALCLEVLEHLKTPELAVMQLARWTQRAAIVSVPWEPYFRLGNLARGKYLATGGNHPEHVQAFSPARLRRLLTRNFAQVDVETCFPWLIAVACHTPG
jgi:hypothetical protein